MHWLDAVRYADTCGFHGDNAFPAWPYRDYVLHAFRDNKPFDEFTREQLAGDLMPNATVEQRVASAYNRLNRTSAEGGLQPKEYLAKYAADRVRTTVAVWMGSTLGCAECHDHKFDPFTVARLLLDEGVLRRYQGDRPGAGSRRKDAWGSQLALPTPEQQKRQEELKAQVAEARDAPGGEDGSAGAAARRVGEANCSRVTTAGELAWRVQRPISAKSANGAVLKIYNDERWTTALRRRQPRPTAAGQWPDRRERTESRQRNVHRHVQAGRRHVDGAGHRDGAGREPARHCAWRAAPIAW